MTDTDIKGILFDKDGTLLDFNATWLAPYRRAAEYLHQRFGARADADDLLARGGFNAGTKTWRADSPLASGHEREIMECWSRAIGTPLPADDRRVLSSFFALPADAYSPAVPDLPALLAELRDGRRLGLATMDGEANARTTLRALGVGAMFDFVCGADSGHGVKPDAGMAHAFCAACDLAPASVMVVGDSPRDLAMGRAAGAVTVAVTTGAHTAADLAPLADLVLADIAGLPAALAGRQGRCR